MGGEPSGGSDVSPMRADGKAQGDSVAAGAPPRASACPFSGSSTASAFGRPKQKEVLNPRNMMPEMPQAPAPDQTIPLSKDREVSTIPKSGSDENWVYPSPQQFYHALLRKNKSAEADAMEDVVRVHNMSNEESWNKVLEWEQFHKGWCPTPSLLRFVGKSNELSWGAWWSSRFSYRGVPFDRHDWFVDRCGQQVRYVIDYYDDPHAGNEEEITVEVRPAFDSFSAAWDRFRWPGWHVQRIWRAVFGVGAASTPAIKQ